MKKKVKARWLAALRGGDYLQGTAALRCGDSFCCLGVLCDLHSRLAFVGWEYDEHTGLYRYLGETMMLPPEVRAWAGIADPNPALRELFVSTYNDTKRLSFKRIARLIDRHW